MKWKKGRRSENLEDRRGDGPASGGGLSGLPGLNLPNINLGGKGCMGVGGGIGTLVVLGAILLLGGGIGG